MIIHSDSSQSTFLLLCRGSPLDEAEVIAICANSNLVSSFVEQLLETMGPDADESDPVRKLLQQAQRDALELILQGR